MEKLRVWSNALALIAVPIVIAFTGHWYAQAIKNQEIRAEFVSLAVDILSNSSAQKNEDEPSIRKWAVDVIDEYSGVPIPATLAEAIAEGRSSLFAVTDDLCAREFFMALSDPGRIYGVTIDDAQGLGCVHESDGGFIVPTGSFGFAAMPSIINQICKGLNVSRSFATTKFYERYCAPS